MPLKATITSRIQATLTGAPDIGGAAHRIDETATSIFSDGTGASQAQQLFTDTRTLAASAAESLDLAGGLSNALGAVLTFTAVKAIRVRAAAANTNDVVVKPAAANGFLGPFGAAAHQVSVPPGGVMLLTRDDAAGWPVTAATADLLSLGNSGAGTAVTYTIEIIGEG